MQRILIVLFISSPLIAQLDDFSGQLETIKELLPTATTVGIIYNPQNFPGVESEFTRASSQTGLRVIQTPMRSIRDISGAMKALAPYNVSFIYLVEDRLVTGKNAIKFIVKGSKKKQIPVFSSDENIFVSGGFGRLVKGEDGEWQLQVNGKVTNDFPIEVPSDNEKIVVMP